MAERPYMSLGVVELEGIFLAATDSDVLEVLQYELNHRKTKAAKKLLEKVNGKLGVNPEKTENFSVWKVEYTELKNRHDLLRGTFTIEGEILARWGMTNSIPRDFEILIFDLWSKNINATEDLFGRTSSQLSSDLEKLQNERKGMNPKALINLNTEEEIGE